MPRRAPLPEALAQFERAIERQRERADKSRKPRGLAWAVLSAYVLGDQGNFDGAHAAFAEALDAVADPGMPCRPASRAGARPCCFGRALGRGAREADIRNHVTQVRSMLTCAIIRRQRLCAAWMLERAPEAPQQIPDAIRY